MLTLKITSKFRKDYKAIKKRGYNVAKLEMILDTLLTGEKLSPKHADHALSGNYAGFRECHIEPDWLLVYTINEDELILTASRTGTHSDLFR